MATITLNLDERSIKNGMCPVRIRISHKGTNCFIGSGVSVEPQYFIGGSLYDMVHRKAQMSVEKRDRIAEQVRMLETFLSEVDRDELARMTANDIRDRAGLGKAKRDDTASVYNINGAGVFNRNAMRVSNKNASTDFLMWYESFGESRRTAKTQESYAYGLKVLRQYCDARRLLSLSLCDIDYARLSDFACWMMGTGRFKDATRHMVECYIRAAYKEAQKRRLVNRDLDPYYDYSIKPIPRKEIDCLNSQEMHQLMTAELTTKGMRWARDLAVMSFCLCGANLLDLYEMKEPKNGEVVFVRHKIEGHYQQPIHIYVEPELRELIGQYKGDGRMLHFKSTYANYESFRHKIGHRLREVSSELGFDVNMAKVRRTWATIAAEIECPDAVIDMCMGHIPQTVNRKHYIKPKWETAAKWNRKVIDYVLKA